MCRQHFEGKEGPEKEKCGNEPNKNVSKESIKRALSLYEIVNIKKNTIQLERMTFDRFDKEEFQPLCGSSQLTFVLKSYLEEYAREKLIM